MNRFGGGDHPGPSLRPALVGGAEVGGAADPELLVAGVDGEGEGGGACVQVLLYITRAHPGPPEQTNLNKTHFSLVEAHLLSRML